MLTALAFVTLGLLADQRPRPAAMVLDLRGPVQIRPSQGGPRRAEVGDLLYPGERLAVPADRRRRPTHRSA